ncbi:preprotein translocase subunit SecE [Allobaculum mucilyticum]|uniref:preprotein translocase subunit SecE n=1 Tax=Allobaculum mucilyticum TaxID=2834459 RepID=UPI001E502662|nr:preprotein translocase subunit SecE [Allobaculum mucilyticum]UNT95911.1 preprotein translocase subunit SecE [Allobaculum mucilyticum]
MAENEIKDPTYSPKAIWSELKKVKWPTFKELMQSSGLVILFTFLFGLYFFICEVCASGLISWIVSI